MTTITEIQTTQVYQVFIKATPEAIWEAITNPEFTQKYFHGARIELAGGRRISRGPGGETVLTLVSDDNFSALQSTVLLQFRLAGGSA